MSKRHKKKQNAEIRSSVQNVSVEIDYDKLTKLIVRAQEETERTKEERKRAAHEALIHKRKEILHEKDYANVKCWLWRHILFGINEVGVMRRLLFLSKKNAKHFSGVMPLTKMLTLSLVSVIKYGFYFLTMTCLIGAYSSFGEFAVLTWLVGAFMFFLLARMVRIAGFEIDHMENGTELMNTAMLVMTVFTVIFAAVSAVLSVMN